jgi:hypothetical protein
MSVQLSQALASSTFFLVYSTCQNHPIDRLSFSLSNNTCKPEATDSTSVNINTLGSQE